MFLKWFILKITIITDDNVDGRHNTLSIFKLKFMTRIQLIIKKEVYLITSKGFKFYWKWVVFLLFNFILIKWFKVFYHRKVLNLKLKSLV